MVTSAAVKECAQAHGADLVGVASMDRFEGAPPEMDPRQIFPEAEAVVVMGFRIPRGCFRGIEEGTYFAAYPAMGYAGINLLAAPSALRATTLFLEDHGYESVPVQNMVIDAAVDIQHGTLKGRQPAAPDRPAPDVMVHFRLAAVAAGLGELGYSKVFLSPQYGPRQRLALLITDAPLEPDPLYEGQICDRCMLCVQECPGTAISATDTIEVELAGKRLAWGKLDVDRCTLAYTGGVRELCPFVPDDFPEFEEAAANPWESIAKIPFNNNSLAIFHHLGALGGARGCIRACMMHLEETGRIATRFRKPFRRRPPWRISRDPPAASSAP